MNPLKPFLWLSLVFLVASLGHAEKSCGRATIISGSSCSNLKVRFNLEECGGKKEERAQIDCKVDRADALVFGEAHTYHIPAREIAPGVWILVGTIREYPKKWRPEPIGMGPIEFRANPSKELNPSWPAVFEVSGQFRFRVEENRRNDFLSNRGFSSLRARAGLGFLPNENVRFLIQPQACHRFGEPVLQPVTPNYNVAVGTSGLNQDPQLTFHQAFTEIRPVKSWRLILGRQTLSFGDEVLIGPSDWENPGRSFDGARSRVEWGLHSWDLFSTKLWDNNTLNSGRGDKDFHGTYFSWAHPSQKVTVEPYLLWLRDHRTSLNQIVTSGFHLRANVGDLELGAEASGQWGDSTGQQVWAEIRSKRFLSLEAHIALDGFWSSPEFNPLFASTHKWLGWADVLGRRNLAGLGFQAGLVSLFRTELGIRGLYFLKSNPDFPAYQIDGTTPVNSVTGQGQTLGSEVDISLKSTILPSTEVLAAASFFFPSENLKATGTESWLGRFEVSVVSNF